MSAEVDGIADEFAKELKAIRRLLATVEGTEDGVGSVDTTLRIAAANGSILLVAASFEQFVRELIEEFGVSVLRSSASFSAIPSEIAKAAWERSLYLLRGLGYGSQIFDRTSAATSIQILDGFCLNENITPDVAKLLAYNMNNMKAAEIYFSTSWYKRFLLFSRAK